MPASTTPATPATTAVSAAATTTTPAHSSTGTQQGTSDGNNTGNASRSRRQANNRRENRTNTVPRTQIPAFKGANESIATLGTRLERKDKDQFLSFQKSLEQHVMTEFKNPADIVIAVREIKDPIKLLLKDMPTEADLVADMGLTVDQQMDTSMMASINKLFGEDMKVFAGQRLVVKQNKTKLYGVIWGQCTSALQSELMGDPAYKMKLTEFDCVWLLSTLKLLSAGMDKNSNTYVSTFHALKGFYSLRQTREETMEAYHRRFESAVATAEMSKGNLLTHEKLSAYEKDRNKTDPDKLAEDSFLAIAFLENADSARFNGLSRELRNSMLLGQDNYPVHLTAAYDLLCNYRPVPTGRREERENDTAVNVSFAQVTQDNNTGTDNQAVIPGNNGVTSTHTFCYACRQHGHIARYCPSPRDQRAGGIQSMQIGIALAQVPEKNGSDLISPHWLLLDSGSTVSSIRNPDLLKDIRKSDETMRVYTNGGHQDYDEVGTLHMFPFTAYYNPKSLANILSLAEVSSVFRVTMDSAADPAMLVHVGPATILVFKQCGSGLYYHDTANQTSSAVIDYSFLSTVAQNKEYFSRAEIEGADQARILQDNISWPSTEDYKHYISSNQLRNCTVTIDDVTRAEAIYGPQVPILKGKMVRRRPEHFTSIPRVQIPAPLLEHHPTDELNMDYMYINGTPYLHTKSSVIKFNSVQHCKGRGRKEMERGIDKVTSKFTQRGIKIIAYNGDNEFEKLRDHVAPAALNIVARGEHLGPIERSVRTIKERVRCSCHAIPYKRIPKLMTQSVVEKTVTWLNAFAARDGVSQTLSPAAIILGTPNPDCQNLKITFGSYAQVYESTTNTTKARSIGAIALKPSNERGGYYFMSLSTGKRLHCYQWKELPVTDYVIDRVEDLAAQENQPIMTNGYPIFEWTPGVPILEEDETEGEEHEEVELENEDIMYEDVSDDELSDDEDDPYYAPNNDNANEVSADDGEAQEHENEEEPSSEDESAANDREIVEIEDDDAVNEDDDTPQANEGADANENTANEGADTNDISHLEQRSDKRPKRSEQARQRQHYAPSFEGKSYDTQFFGVTPKQENEQSSDECHRIAVNVMFAQMGAKKGIKLFGQRAVAAMFKEYNQLNDMSVFGKVDPDTLTQEQKKKALRAINLITEKRCGKIKGRAVADGRTQRAYIPREEATSPTVSTESLMVSLVIDAFEKRDVAIFDVPGAYLNAYMPDDKFVLLKLEGEFVDIMCEVNPEYTNDVRHEQGKKVLYLRVLKALYGCIESALLWYEMYSSTLEKMGFVINPYDKCVANKIIDGKQCTIVWYVDDNKLSHVDEKVVTKIIEDIKLDYGDLVISRGKEHKFLGMNIKFNENNTVQIGQKEYIAESIELFDEDVSQNVSTPATKNLFVVNPDAEPLDESKADIFHSVVAKLLWVMKRSRPDIETVISFLCTRVSCSDTDDWKKLRRLLQFLSQTIDDERVMGADSLHHLNTFVDGSYAIHPDMKSHTGGAMSFGIGVVHGRAGKQRMNTKSSTETEVVAASEYLPFNIWLRHFMEAQGYPLTSNIFHQDNQSAMKMEKNGRNSCTGNSRHIHIRHFFIKDQVDGKHLDIVYCPTLEMLADYYTKALQGQLFHRFRDVLMGWKHINTLKDTLPSSSKERVGDIDESETVRQPPRTYAQAVKQGNHKKVSFEDSTNVQE